MKEATFTVDGTNYKIRKPHNDEYREANRVYNRAFSDALKSDCELKANMKEILTKKGLWNDTKQQELEELQRETTELEFTLHKGGIKKSEARNVSLELKKLRDKLRSVLFPINDFNKHTAEGQADNAKFDYLASVCIVNEDGSPYFKDYDDYLSKDSDKVAIAGARKFASIFYDLQESYDSTLIENQVLKQLGFANDKYELIDSKGRLIDEDGRLLDENGRYIDEEGNYIDIYGHKLTKEGEFLGERGVFIDDEADKLEETASNQTE